MGTLFEVNGSTGVVNFRAKGTSNLVIENGTSLPGSGIEGQVFWKSDTDSLFIHNGTSFLGIGVGYNRVYNEVPSGLVNGSNTLYTLANAYVNGTTMVTRDGLMMKGGGVDYTETSPSAATITFTTAPATNSVILVSYSRIEAAMLPSMEKFDCVVGTPSSTYTGSTTVFDLPFAYTVGNNALLVYGSGMIMLKGATKDYQETTSAQITFNSARTSGEVIQFVKLGYNDATGEANTGSNVGTGTGLIFRDKIGTTLNFKSLLAGSGITLTNNANDVTITASASAAGGWLDNTPHVDLQTSTNQVRIGNGSAGTPALSFLSDTVTGMYRVGANDLGFSTNSTLRLDISTTGITSTLPHLNADGTAAAPAYAFTNDTDCGMYRIGVNNIGLSANGGLAAEWDGSNFFIDRGALFLQNGAAATPSLTFGGDSDTGLYHIGANNISLTAGGASVLEIATGTVVARQDLYSTRSNVGGFVIGQIENSDNTNGASTARLNLVVGGTSGGDAQILFHIPSSTDWSIGLDNSDSDKFKLSNSNALGTTDYITVTTSGQVGIGTSPSQLLHLVGAAASTNYFVQLDATSTSGQGGFNTTANISGSQAGFSITQFGSAINPSSVAGISQISMARLRADATVSSLMIDTGGSLPIYFATNDTLAVKIDTNQQVLFTDGSVNNPSISFINGTAMGIYRVGTNAMGFSTNSTQRLQLTSGGDVRPGADNNQQLGTASFRWSDVYGVTIHSGDVHMENDWRITEGEKIGHPEEGIMFLSPSGKKYKIAMTEVE